MSWEDFQKEEEAEERRIRAEERRQLRSLLSSFKRDPYRDIMSGANILGDDSTTAIEAGKDDLAEDALGEGFKISPVKPPPGQPETPEKPKALDSDWLTEQGFWKPENIDKEEELAKKHWQDRVPTVKKVGRIRRGFGRQTGEADVTFPDKTVRRMPYEEAYKFIKQPDETWADYAARRKAESIGLRKAMPSFFDPDARVLDAATDPTETTRETAAGVVQETTPGTPGIDTSVDVRERHGIAKQEPWSLARQLEASEGLMEKAGAVVISAALPLYQVGLRIAKDSAGVWKPIGVNPTAVERVAQRQLNMIAKAGGVGWNLENLLYETGDFIQGLLPTVQPLERGLLGDYVDFDLPTSGGRPYEPNTRTAFGDDQITKYEWGVLAAYTANRMNIVGDSRRKLRVDPRAQEPRVEPIQAPLEATGLPMPQAMAQVTFADGTQEVMPMSSANKVLSEHRKKHPVGHWGEEEWTEFSAERWWDNTLAEAEGIVSIIPATVSGLHWVGSGRRLGQVAGTTAHYLGAETAAYTGEHLGMLAQGDLGRFVEAGLLSTVADLSLIPQGVSAAAVARASRLTKNVQASVDVRVRGARADQLLKKADSLEAAAADIRVKLEQKEVVLEQAKRDKLAAETFPHADEAARSAVMKKVDEDLALAQKEVDELTRLSVAADDRVRATSGAVERYVEKMPPAHIYEITDEIVGDQVMKTRDVDPLPSEIRSVEKTYDELHKDLTDLINKEQAHLAEAEQTLSGAARVGLAQKEARAPLALSPEELSKYTTLTGELKPVVMRLIEAGEIDAVPVEILQRYQGRIRQAYSSPNGGGEKLIAKLEAKLAKDLYPEIPGSPEGWVPTPRKATTDVGEWIDTRPRGPIREGIRELEVERGRDLLPASEVKQRIWERAFLTPEDVAPGVKTPPVKIAPAPDDATVHLTNLNASLPRATELGLEALRRERAALQQRVRLAGHENIKDIADRLASGEMQYVDLIQKGWSVEDVIDLDRLRELSGSYSPMARLSAEQVRNNIRKIKRDGAKAAVEEMNSLNAADQRASRTAAMKTRVLADNAKTDFAEAAQGLADRLLEKSKIAKTKTGAEGVERLEKVASVIRENIRKLEVERDLLSASAIKRPKAKRKTEHVGEELLVDAADPLGKTAGPLGKFVAKRTGVDMTAREIGLLDRAVWWEGVARASKMLYYTLDPVGWIGSANRMKNWMIDRYGITNESFVFSNRTTGEAFGGLSGIDKALPWKYTKQEAHELMLASRYWLRSPTRTDSVPLALYNSIAREAEGEIHKSSFRVKQVLKDISDYRVVTVTKEALENPAAFLANLAEEHKTDVRGIVAKNKIKSSAGRKRAQMEKEARPIEAIEEDLKGIPKNASNETLGAFINSLSDADLLEHGKLLKVWAAKYRKPLLQGWDALEVYIANKVRGINKKLKAAEKDERVSFGDAFKEQLKEGDTIVVRDIHNPKRREERLMTMSQALHFEHAEVTKNTTRVVEEKKMPNGGTRKEVRFEARDTAGEEWKDWVVTANHYKEIFDFSVQLTIESIETGLLKDLPGLHEIWAPNVYPLERRIEAAKKRLLKDKEADLESLRAGGASDRSLKSKEKDWNTKIDQVASDIKTKDALQSSGTARGLGGVAGDSLRRRELGAIDPETGEAMIPIDERIGRHGMAADLHSTVMIGMLRQKRDIATARMWKRIASSPDIMSRLEKPGWVEVKNVEIEGTSALRYGNDVPKVFYLHPDVYWDLKGTGVMLEHSQKAPVQLLSFWKGMKTAMSIGSHVTNALTNTLVLGPMAGLSPLNPNDARFFGEAAKEFWKGGNSKKYQEFVVSQGRGPAGQINKLEMVVDTKKAYGALYTGISGQSKNAMETFFKIFETTADPADSRMWSRVGKVLDRKRADALKDLLVDYPGLLYQAGDDFFRYALYLKNTAKGMGSIEAAQVSRRAFAAYESIAPMFRWIATSPFGKPFLAFDAAMVPQVVRWLRESPVRANIWMNLYESMTDINFAASEMTRERWEEYQQNLPNYDANRMAGIRKIFPTLGQDALGQERYWNWQRMAIGSRLFPEEGEKAFGSKHLNRSLGSENPFLAATQVGFFDRDLKFNRYYDPDDPTSAAAKRQWFKQTLLPPNVPGGYAWNRLGDSGFRFLSNNELGRPRRGRLTAESPAEALLYFFTGQRLATYDPMERAGLKAQEQQFEDMSIELKGAKGAYTRGLKSFINDTHRFLKTPDQLRGFLEKIAEDPKGLAAMKQNTIDDEVKAAMDARDSARHARFANMYVRAKDARMGRGPSTSPAAAKAANQAALKELNKRIDKTTKSVLLRKWKVSDLGKYSEVLEYIKSQDQTDAWKGEARIKVYDKIIKNLNARGHHKEAAEFVRGFLQHQKHDSYLEAWHTLEKNKKKKTTWYQMKLRAIKSSQRRAIKKKAGVN